MIGPLGEIAVTAVELVDVPFAQVTLLDGTREVYGPMSLSRDE